MDSMDLAPEARRSSLSRLISSVNNVSDSIASSRRMIALSALSTVACSAAVFGVVFAANEYSKETKMAGHELRSKQGGIVETRVKISGFNPEGSIMQTLQRYDCPLSGGDKRGRGPPFSVGAIGVGADGDLELYEGGTNIPGDQQVMAGQIVTQLLLWSPTNTQDMNHQLCNNCCSGCGGAGVDCTSCCDCCCCCCALCGGPNACDFFDYNECWNTGMLTALAGNDDDFAAKCNGCCCCCCCCCCCGDDNKKYTGTQGFYEEDVQGTDNGGEFAAEGDDGTDLDWGYGIGSLPGDEARALQGACKGRNLEGACKGRDLEGACKGRSLEGACKGRGLSGGCKGRGLAGGCKGRNLTGACKGRNLEGACKGRDLEGACKGRHLSCKGRDLMGAERDLEGACKGRHVQENPEMFSEEFAKNFVEGAEPCKMSQEAILYAIPRSGKEGLVIKTTLETYQFLSGVVIDSAGKKSTAHILSL